MCSDDDGEREGEGTMSVEFIIIGYIKLDLFFFFLEISYFELLRSILRIPFLKFNRCFDDR